MENLRTHFLIYSTLLTVAVVLFAQQVLSFQEIISYGSVASVPSIAWSVFDRWAWKLSIINKFLHPNLNGLWRGTCIPDGENTPHEITLTIEQTYSTICINSNSERTDSPSRVASLEKHYGNSWQLVYTWVGSFKTNMAQSGNVFGTTTLSLIPQFCELRGEYVSCGRSLTKGIISVTKIPTPE